MFFEKELVQTMFRFWIEFWTISNICFILLSWFSHTFRHRFWYLLLHSFWTDLCSKMGSQISQRAAIFHKKDEKCSVPPTAVGILSPTLRPTTPQKQSKNTFGLIWIEFWQMLKKLKGLGRCCINFDLIFVDSGSLRAGFLHFLRPSNSPTIPNDTEAMNDETTKPQNTNNETTKQGRHDERRNDKNNETTKEETTKRRRPSVKKS